MSQKYPIQIQDLTMNKDWTTGKQDSSTAPPKVEPFSSGKYPDPAANSGKPKYLKFSTTLEVSKGRVVIKKQ